MDKYFICLANSYKRGGRCIAGIEINYLNGSFRIVRNNGLPTWIRPVTHNQFGQIDYLEVANIHLLDIVKVDVTNCCPDGAHKENVFYNGTLQKCGNIKRTNKNLEMLLDDTHEKIFFNRGKAITSDVFKTGDYSLMFIKPENPRFYQEQLEKRERTRLEFVFNGNQYDLPVTDPVYLDAAISNPNFYLGQKKTGFAYCTLSLGANYNEWHHKLVAGIIVLKNM